MSGQLALALNHAHEKGILLRNLSSDSVLVERTGRIRLANFEQAKETDYSKRRCSETGLPFLAPEVIQRQGYGKEADWYAFGVILFELLSGTNPLDVYCANKDIDADGHHPTDVLLRGERQSR